MISHIDHMIVRIPIRRVCLYTN